MELETHFQTENSKYKCSYGIITGITITTSDGFTNVKDKVENLQKDLPSGYEIYNGNTKANNNDTIVTGMTVKKDEKEVAIVVVYGDVDGDSYIGSTDALEIGQYIQEIENSIPDYKKIAMDINNDGIISNEDSEKILSIETQEVNVIYGKDEYYQNEYAKDPNSIKISNE